VEDRFSVTHRLGDGDIVDEITVDLVDGLLSELDEDLADPEHFEVAITDEETGWCLVAYGGSKGQMLWCNADGPRVERVMTGLSRHKMAELFLMLGRERFDEIGQEPWVVEPPRQIDMAAYDRLRRGEG
jgi:hypothetical protein